MKRDVKLNCLLIGAIPFHRQVLPNWLDARICAIRQILLSSGKIWVGLS